MRNYGRILQAMVEVAAEEQDLDKRQKMTLYIARCMRYKNMTWNKDQESGIVRVKEDIATLSNGQLSCDFPEFEVEFFRNVPQPPQQNGKKKK